jgi:hypothetical protein
MTVGVDAPSELGSVFPPTVAQAFTRVLEQTLEGQTNLDTALILDAATSLGLRRAELLERRVIPPDVEYVLTIWCWWPLKIPPPDSYRDVVDMRIRRPLIQGDVYAASNAILEVGLVLPIDLMHRAVAEGRANWLFAPLDG